MNRNLYNILRIALALFIIEGASIVAFGQIQDLFPNLTTASPSGRGDSDSNPYLIRNKADLYYLAMIVNTKNYEYSTNTYVNASFRKFFKVDATDIDLTPNPGAPVDPSYNSADVWIPIGDQIDGSSSIGHFQGYFDGNNCVLKNMTMNINSLIPNDGSTGEDWTGQAPMAVLGMFGSPQITSSDSITIRNVFIKDAVIELNEGEYFYNNGIGVSIEMGLLVGFPQFGKCIISNCIAQGEITFLCDDYSPYGTIFGIGGMIGDLAGGDNVVVDNCFANTKMNLKIPEYNLGSSPTVVLGIGGFVGDFDASHPCEINNCGAWIDMQIEATGPIDLVTGGFMGTASTSVNFYNCYARGRIEVKDGSYGVSGFANLISGNFLFDNCYVATTIKRGTNTYLTTNTESQFSGWGVNFGATEICVNSYYLDDWQEGDWTDYTAGIFSSPIYFDNQSPCTGAGQTKDYMLSPAFVQDLNPVDSVFAFDGYGFLKNAGFPVLGLEPVMDPQIIDSGQVVTIPSTWHPDMTDDYYNPQHGIYLYDGGQFINESPNPYVVNVYRDLSGDGWEFVGLPINNDGYASTFGWLSNDTLFLNGSGSQVSTGLNETFNGTTDMSEHWNTTHNYIVAYPFRYDNNDWSNVHAYRTDSMKNGFGYMVWNGGMDYRLDKDGNFFTEEDNNPRPSSTPINPNPNPLGSQQNATPPYNPAPTQVCFVGNVHQKGSTITVTLPANSASNKWYALANPYTYDLDIATFISQNNSAIQGGSVYVWDVSAQNWVVTSMGKIPYGRGFVIRASSGATITFAQ
ncbi:MAG: hypothetical protein LBR84_11535 [Tannerella sp.]|jgi:hypothetical protein|nr:hypothetical protein [Tannerella sp.]